MELFQQYVTKKYVLSWMLFFLIWYPISFLFSVSYNVTQNQFLSVAMNTFFPVLLFCFAFHYFKNNKNDWNERLILGIGWIVLSIVFSAILAKPVYGSSWLTILNIEQFIANWISLFAVILAGISVESWKKKKRSIF